MHKVTFDTGLIVVFGFTLMLKFKGVPLQVTPFTTTVAVTDTSDERTLTLLAFAAVKIGIEPFPLTANPMFALAFVQEKVVFATGLVKETTLD